MVPRQLGQMIGSLISRRKVYKNIHSKLPLQGKRYTITHHGGMNCNNFGCPMSIIRSMSGFFKDYSGNTIHDGVDSVPDHFAPNPSLPLEISLGRLWSRSPEGRILGFFGIMGQLFEAFSLLSRGPSCLYGIGPWRIYGRSEMLRVCVLLDWIWWVPHSEGLDKVLWGLRTLGSAMDFLLRAGDTCLHLSSQPVPNVVSEILSRRVDVIICDCRWGDLENLPNFRSPVEE